MRRVLKARVVPGCCLFEDVRWGTMYRVFEALDELVQTVEQAYGVPMTVNCMVPRNEVLALLDDVRNAIPAELDDAQDVLDKQDEILDAAQRRAARSASSAARSPA